MSKNKIVNTIAILLLSTFVVCCLVTLIRGFLNTNEYTKSSEHKASVIKNITSIISEYDEYSDALESYNFFLSTIDENNMTFSEEEDLRDYKEKCEHNKSNVKFYYALSIQPYKYISDTQKQEIKEYFKDRLSENQKQQIRSTLGIGNSKDEIFNQIFD